LTTRTYPHRTVYASRQMPTEWRWKTYSSRMIPKALHSDGSRRIASYRGASRRRLLPPVSLLAPSQVEGSPDPETSGFAPRDL